MARGQIVTELNPPEQGARGDLPPHRLPEGAVPFGYTRNVVIRDGALANRPGFAQINGNTVGGRPTGGFLFEPGDSHFTVVGTTTGLFKLNAGGTDYDDLTGTTTPSGTSDDPWRFAVFPTDVPYLIGTNQADTPQVWNGTDPTFSDLNAADAPQAGDITTAANRVILVDTIESGVAFQYRVRWSGFNDHTAWDPLDFADLSDTPDVIVGARALSRVAFAIYKKKSQWVGLLQTGQFPFKFELQDLKPGPVGPAAVVVADGRHYYIGVDGSVYVFDGIKGTHVGEPARRFILNNFNFDAPRRCFGYFSRRDRDIYWWFCQPGQDDPDIGISLQIDTGRFFPHTFRSSMGCGFEGDLVSTITWDSLSGFTWDDIAATYPTWNSFGSASQPVEVIGGTDGMVHQFGVAATDNGDAPSAQWAFVNRVLASVSERARVESLDHFFPITSTAQDITISTGTTDTMGATPTFPAELSSTHDIGDTGDTIHQDNRATATPGYGSGTAEARFHTVKYEIDTETDWVWYGTHVRSYLERTSSP